MAKDSLGIAEKIKQLKELLDIGAITQEEFEYKKIALLNPDKEDKYLKALELIKQNNENSLSNAVMLLNNVGNYRNAEELLIQTADRAEKAKNKALYDNAIQLMEENTIVSLNNAINKFRHITDGYGAQELILTCEERIVELKQQIEEEEKEKAKQEIIDKKQEHTNRIFLAITKVICIICMLSVPLSQYLCTYVAVNKQFDIAETYIEEGNYKDANAILKDGIKYNVPMGTFSRANPHTSQLKNSLNGKLFMRKVEICSKIAQKYLEKNDYEGYFKYWKSVMKGEMNWFSRMYEGNVKIEIYCTLDPSQYNDYYKTFCDIVRSGDIDEFYSPEWYTGEEWAYDAMLSILPETYR